MPPLHLTILILAPLIALACTSCTTVVREQDLFHPRRMPADAWKGHTDAGGLRWEPFEVPLEGTAALRGWLVGSDRYRRSFLYYYGNAETVLESRGIVEWFALTFETNVLAVDYRGYGFSDGAPTMDALADDGLRVYDAFMSRPGRSAGPVFLYGHSLGAGVAVHVAARRPTAGVVLESPPTSAADVIPGWRRLYPWYMRWMIQVKPDRALIERHPQPVEEIREVKAPLLILHGGKDDLIPQEFGRRMYEAAGSEYKYWCPVPEAGHNNTPRHPEALKAVREFVEKHRGD